MPTDINVDKGMSSHELARKLLELPDVLAVVADGCCALIPAIKEVTYMEGMPDKNEPEHRWVHLIGQKHWPIVFLD